MKVHLLWSGFFIDVVVFFYPFRSQTVQSGYEVFFLFFPLGSVGAGVGEEDPVYQGLFFERRQISVLVSGYGFQILLRDFYVF